MYPLNVQLPAPGIGFAVANTEEEHIALTARGYLPAYVAPSIPPAPSKPTKPEGEGHTRESVMAALDAAGIDYDKRLGLEKLVSLLPAA